jgi:hypothetical protein
MICEPEGVWTQGIPKRFGVHRHRGARTTESRQNEKIIDSQRGHCGELEANHGDARMRPGQCGFNRLAISSTIRIADFDYSLFAISLSWRFCENGAFSSAAAPAAKHAPAPLPCSAHHEPSDSGREHQTIIKSDWIKSWNMSSRRPPRPPSQ